MTKMDSINRLISFGMNTLAAWIYFEKEVRTIYLSNNLSIFDKTRGVTDTDIKAIQDWNEKN
ncbi:hypothetical protein QNH48_28070 [Neobacillus sp. YX16]|uniref:hypothetical protein n=1 Tax=Neobacillus sp. YX16 TaxID=3047874 RepID=UPI0024C2EB44|nr:hypothetical protein [Neobacillus sp. YX16]WHZ02731.1 hypothetical protein QNH48_28070 [Neobacillus sp. YX16]